MAVLGLVVGSGGGGAVVPRGLVDLGYDIGSEELGEFLAVS